MKKIACFVVFVFCFVATQAEAGTSGVLTYEVVNHTQRVMITDCVASTSGTVTIPETLEGKPVAYIGNTAFQHCSQITEIILPENLELIARSFGGCSSLTSIIFPENLYRIDTGAFENCTQLKRAVFKGNAPSTFGSNVFSNVASGFKIYYADDASGFSNPWNTYTAESYNHKFSFKILSGSPETITITDYPTSETGELDVPSTLVGLSVTHIGENSFNDCGQLTRVTLPNSITSIGDYAFNECNGLTTFTIPADVTSIGESAFADAGIDSFFFEGDAPLLGEYVFDGYTHTKYYLKGAQGYDESPWTYAVEYTGLYDFDVYKETIKITDYPTTETGPVTIPNTLVGKPVVSIGENAFYSCRALTGLSIPANVTHIAQSAMRNASGMKSFSVEAGNSSYSSDAGILLDLNETELLFYPASSSREHYEIPNTVTSVLAWAFLDGTNLHSVTIPSGISNLNSQAFYGCSELTSAVFLGNVPDLAGRAFDDNAPSFTMYYPDSNTNVSSSSWNGNPSESFDANYSFKIADDIVTIDGYAPNTGASVQIPETFAGFPVRQISFPGFSGKNTTSYTLPDNLAYLTIQSFRFNRQLPNIIIPDQVIYMGNKVFEGCEKLEYALFSGDAPATFGTDVFVGTHTNFTIYYFSDSSGFSSPTWNGYPATAIDRTVHPAAEWLMAHDLDYDTDLQADINSDEVTLLMEYALDLDPRTNNKGNLPKIFIDNETDIVGITYHIGSSGVVYTVDATTNLLGTWTSAGLFHSGNGNLQSSFMYQNGTKQFLRLKVEAAAP